MAEFFAHPIPAVILLLGVLVLVHELGHFVVGRLCGIAVEVFSIGFGPRIFGFTRRGTEYRVSWIPLGGFVKFAGSHPSEEVPEGLPGQAFRAVSLPRRAVTVAAGPAANFLLAILVYTVLAMDGIQLPPAVIGEVVAGSPAQAAGLRYGDKLLKIGGEAIASWLDLEKHISASPGRELALVVERDGATVGLRLTPGVVEVPDMAGRPVKIGRAGVALGRLPAIVTIRDLQSVAGRAGLRTGDRVAAVVVNGSDTPVTYYPELTAVLAAQAAQGQKKVTLKIYQAPVPGADDDDAGGQAKTEPVVPEREVTLPLEALATLPPDANERQVGQVLGLNDSQLTVADATETLQGVLRPGDVLTHWQDQPLRDVFQLGELLRNNVAEMVDVTVDRGGKSLPLLLALKGVEAQRPEGKVTVFTLPVVFYGQPEEPPPLVEKYSNPVAALGYGLKETAVQTGALFGAIANLISGEIPLKALGGPMLIAKVAGDSARHGWQTFIGSMALISINLGLLNLFPIPVLDGGQLLLMGAEGVRRRPLRETAVENFQKVGFAMILALVVLATYNDLSRFWKSMLESVVGIFQ
jgi:regulator of sigma E protease